MEAFAQHLKVSPCRSIATSLRRQLFTNPAKKVEKSFVNRGLTIRRLGDLNMVSRDRRRNDLWDLWVAAIAIHDKNASAEGDAQDSSSKERAMRFEEDRDLKTPIRLKHSELT